VVLGPASCESGEVCGLSGSGRRWGLVIDVSMILDYGGNED
jgi:hypothetical protein